jgi:hypothetical protein
MQQNRLNTENERIDDLFMKKLSIGNSLMKFKPPYVAPGGPLYLTRKCSCSLSVQFDQCKSRMHTHPREAFLISRGLTV